MILVALSGLLIIVVALLTTWWALLGLAGLFLIIPAVAARDLRSQRSGADRRTQSHRTCRARELRRVRNRVDPGNCGLSPSTSSGRRLSKPAEPPFDRLRAHGFSGSGRMSFSGRMAGPGAGGLEGFERGQARSQVPTSLGDPGVVVVRVGVTAAVVAEQGDNAAPFTRGFHFRD